jgi:hypothetical protein
VDPVPDPILLRKTGSAGNGTPGLWIYSHELRTLDHRGGQNYAVTKDISNKFVYLNNI